jgi:hypothetical protein
MGQGYAMQWCFKELKLEPVQWLTAVILAPPEAEIRRMVVRG